MNVTLRRTLMACVLALILAAMLVVAGPASAQGGCKAFGNGVAFEVQNGTLIQEIPTLAPVNDEVHFFQGLYCS
jgi:hypothetical protein